MRVLSHSFSLSLTFCQSSVHQLAPSFRAWKTKQSILFGVFYTRPFDQHFYGQFHHFITMLYFNTIFTYHPVLLVYLFSSQDGDISSFGCNLQTYTNTFCYSSCLNFSIHKSIPINGNIQYSHTRGRTPIQRWAFWIALKYSISHKNYSVLISKAHRLHICIF